MGSCKVKDIYQYIDSFAPFASQISHDNSGFLIGDGEAAVDKILVALDITPDVLRQAREWGAQLIVSHHPVIYHPAKTLYPSEMPYRVCAAGISAICAHTNLDIASGGVNDCLAGALALQNVRRGCDDGMQRIGELPRAMTAEELAAYVGERLGCGCVRWTPASGEISTVAVCGGNAGRWMRDAMAAGAQAYVTGDVAHDVFLDAARLGFCLLDAGHFPTENVVVGPLAERLARQFPGVRVRAAEGQTEPARVWHR